MGVERHTHRAMDTEFAVSIVVSSLDEVPVAASAAESCFNEIDRLERILSRFEDTSDVAVIRGLSPMDRGLSPSAVATVARETMEVLVTSAKVCAATCGAFDPTVGPLMDRLRVSGSVPSETGSVPMGRRTVWEGVAPETRQEALARGGMQRLVLDVEHCRVAVRPDRLGRPTPLELDFGGIGKGYALDRCAEILAGEQYGFTAFLLDAGTSTVLARGGSWPIGVGGAFKTRTRKPTTLHLSAGALSGSGFEIQGQHVVDVRQAGPAARWAQAWARADSAAVADALSTAALALSPAELRAAAEELHAGFLMARRQRPAFDRFRDPLVAFGSCSGTAAML